MKLQRANHIRGSVRVPGDKSIAHRALILGTLARGHHVVEGIPHAADVQSTISCLTALGAFVEEMPDGYTLVIANAFAPEAALDAGNSGTTARLLSGLIAGQSVTATIDGDESLRRRPMDRVAEPLRSMGAKISTTDGKLPMTIQGGNLEGITYRPPVASAQVKSAVLIAGLSADGETIIDEPVPTRDHTERLLDAMNVTVTRSDGKVSVRGHETLRAVRVQVPGDISSAAFLVTAACCLPESEVYLPTTGVNPTRAGALEVLAAMGASIERVSEEQYLNEPVADLVARSSRLGGVTIGGDTIPSLIDELPVLAVAATQAEGETVVRDAAELRHKESDRIASIVDNLRRMDADIEAADDGFLIRGPCRLKGARVSSFGDHRIAMAMAVAALLADGETEIENSEVVDVSYPNFFGDLRVMTG